MLRTRPPTPHRCKISSCFPRPPVFLPAWPRPETVPPPLLESMPRFALASRWSLGQARTKHRPQRTPFASKSKLHFSRRSRRYSSPCSCQPPRRSQGNPPCRVKQSLGQSRKFESRLPRMKMMKIPVTFSARTISQPHKPTTPESPPRKRKSSRPAHRARRPLPSSRRFYSPLPNLHLLKIPP